eukprot:8884005-Karenia_brevis.AAC.1
MTDYGAGGFFSYYEMLVAYRKHAKPRISSYTLCAYAERSPGQGGPHCCSSTSSEVDKTEFTKGD